MNELSSTNPSTKISISKGLRVLAILALCLAMLVMLAGCIPADKNGETEQNGDQQPGTSVDTGNSTTEPTGDGSIFTDEVVTEQNIFEFVTVGRYLGIEYDQHQILPVTDDDVNTRIRQDMQNLAELIEITDRPVEWGDTAIIDFEGFLDGVAFPGGYAENHSLGIGSGAFIPGFEEQIVGKSLGDEFDIEVMFPETYHQPDLAGQPVVFRIKINGIFAEVLPELTDELVSEYTPFSTVDEYMVLVRAQLEVERIQEADNWNIYNVWSEIIRDTTIHKFPNAEIEFRIARAMMEYEFYAMMYGVPVDYFVFEITNGMSLEDFVEFEVRPYSIEEVAQDLMIRAIASLEGIAVTEAEFNEALQGFIIEYGFENEEQFMEFYGEIPLRVVLLADKVIDMIMQSAIPR